MIDIRARLADVAWRLRMALTLVWSMSYGIKWISMLVRLYIYGMILTRSTVQVLWWYMNSPQILHRVPYRDEGDENTTARDNNRAFADIHFPRPVVEVVLGKNGRGKYPVVVLVSGGAWIIGLHYWSTPMARLLASRGYIVVTPDYRNFPQVTMGGMVGDIEDAIRWTFENIEAFGGDPSRISVVGQSAGGHLIFMAIAQQLERVLAGETPKFIPSRIERAVGLSGIYNLVLMREHFHQRGLYRQVMNRICEGASKMKHYSPIARLEKLPGDFLSEHLPTSVFVHGTADHSAPWKESESIAVMLRQKTGTDKALLRLLTNATHTTPFVEDMLLGTSPVVDLICGLNKGIHPPIHAMASARQLHFASWFCPF